MPVDSIDTAASFRQAEQRKETIGPEEAERRRAERKEQRTRDIDKEEVRRAERRDSERRRKIEAEDARDEEVARERDKGNYIDEMA